VVLDVVENRSGTHPLTLRHTVGYSASARFQRSAVGMDASLSQVGDVVEVLIEIEASKVVERPSGRKR
jgi:polyisoprenoid-binding protein YceI